MNEKLNKVVACRKSRKIRRKNERFIKYVMDSGAVLAEKSKDPKFNKLIKKYTRY